MIDSYIATENHIERKVTLNNIDHLCLTYTAQQGDFSITLPNTQVFTIPYINTVENIAAYIAESIAKEISGDVMVKAFESVEKGAIAEVCSV